MSAVVEFSDQAGTTYASIPEVSEWTVFTLDEYPLIFPAPPRDI